MRGLGSVTWNWRGVVKHLAAESLGAGGTETHLLGRSLAVCAVGLCFCSSAGAASVEGNPNWEMSGGMEVSYLSAFPEP